MAEPDEIAPDGSEIRFLVTNAKRASLVEVTLPAGLTTRPVRHATVEEIWYFVRGEGEVWREGQETVQVAPGASLIIPTRGAFQFRSAPTGPLVFLCYTSPPWPGEDEASPAEGPWTPNL
jgi:mannose-6-phosphate isomerase-like protein (cupin superfamily)